MASLQRQERLNRMRLESVVYACEQLLRAHVRREFQTRFPSRDWRNGAGVNDAIPTIGSSLAPMLRQRLLHEHDSTWDATLLNAVLLGLLENQSSAKARALRRASYQVVAVRNSCAHAAGGRVTEKEFAAHWKTARSAIKTLGGDADAVMRAAMGGEDAQKEASETTPHVAAKTHKEKRKERKELRDKLKKEKNDKKETIRTHPPTSAVKSQSTKPTAAPRDTYYYHDALQHFNSSTSYGSTQDNGYNSSSKKQRKLANGWRKTSKKGSCCCPFVMRAVAIAAVVWLLYHFRDSALVSRGVAALQGLWDSICTGYDKLRVADALQGLWDSIRSGYDALQQRLSPSGDPSLRGSDGSDSPLSGP